MKLLQLLICSLLFAGNGFAVDYKMSVKPKELHAGERASLEVLSTGEIEFGDLPKIDGIRWLEMKNSDYTSRGKKVFVAKQYFLPERSGIIRLPALDLTVDGQSLLMPPRKLEVASGRYSEKGFIRMLYNGKADASDCIGRPGSRCRHPGLPGKRLRL